VKTVQSGTQTAVKRDGNPAWGSRQDGTGRSGNPKGSLTAAEKRARLHSIVEDWVAELAQLGVRAGTVERTLLQRAAQLSLVRPHRNEDQTRTANTISKLLAQAGFRKDRPRKRRTSMVAALGEGQDDGPFGGR
jgi:hypothetical protein